MGEIGGSEEQQAGAWLAQRQPAKPVVAVVAGLCAPEGRRMGHAGAIIAGGRGDARTKLAALRDAGVIIAESPARVGATMARAL